MRELAIPVGELLASVVVRCRRGFVTHPRLATISELDTTIFDSPYNALDRLFAWFNNTRFPAVHRVQHNIRSHRELLLAPTKQCSRCRHLFSCDFHIDGLIKGDKFTSSLGDRLLDRCELAELRITVS
jgi:hypothetical protein